MLVLNLGGWQGATSALSAREVATLNLLLRGLMRIPAVRCLEQERDALRAERDSMRLKVRAASAEMGVLEEQSRVLAVERDRCAEQVKAHTADHERLSAELMATLEICDAVTAERDKLKADRDALAVQHEDAIRERDQFARDLGQLRPDATANSMPAIPLPDPATEKVSGQGA